MKKTSLLIIGSLALAGAAGLAYAFGASGGSYSSSQDEVSGLQDASNQHLIDVQSQNGAAPSSDPSPAPSGSQNGSPENSSVTQVTVDGQSIDVPEKGSKSQTITNDGLTTHVNVSSNTSSSASGGKQRVTNRTTVNTRSHTTNHTENSP